MVRPFRITPQGRVLKIVNLAGKGLSEETSVLVETITVFKRPTPVRNLLVYREAFDNRVETQDYRSAYLVVVSDHQVRRLDLHHCNRAKSCSKCVRLRDPYCAWSGRNCVGRNSGWSNKKFLQSITRGVSKSCPPEMLIRDYDDPFPEEKSPKKSFNPTERSIIADKLPDYPMDNEIEPQFGTEVGTTSCNCDGSVTKRFQDGTSSSSSPGVLLAPKVLDRERSNNVANERSTKIERNLAISGVYSAESMAIAVVIAIVGALIVGFVVGYQFKKRDCFGGKKDPSRSPTVTHQNGPFIGLTHRPNGVHRSHSKTSPINAYEATPKFNGVGPPVAESPVSMDMVLSLDSPLPEKKLQNSDANANTNTLPKGFIYKTRDRIKFKRAEPKSNRL